MARQELARPIDRIEVPPDRSAKLYPKPGGLLGGLGLIDDQDHLIGHADSATAKGEKLGAPFRKRDRLKALVHTWLAWQEEPGRTYGTAIQRDIFDTTVLPQMLALLGSSDSTASPSRPC